MANEERAYLKFKFKKKLKGIFIPRGKPHTATNIEREKDTDESPQFLFDEKRSQLKLRESCQS